METQTYTKRSNARRAGIAAGIPKDQLEITVHKTRNTVRFGFKQKCNDLRASRESIKNSQLPTHGSELAVSIKKVRLKPESYPIATRQKQNGVKRPAPGGLCAAVWEFLDANPTSSAKQVREAAAANGWNINNTLCELYTWRKFHGLTRTNKNRLA